jgi:LCT (Lysosomal Cystine Transporter) family transporter
VQLNDVFFGFHAVLLTAVNIGQIFIYERGGQTLAKWAMLLIFLMVSSSAGFAVAVAAGASGPYTSWLDFFTYLSYVKLAVTLTKYTPQAVLNCRRRSTEGWSVTNVLLDWTGGILSIAQLLLDCGVTGQWSGVAGDPVKFALGFTSMVFDIVFMAQHYCLFPKGGDVGGSYEAVGDYVPGLGGGFDEEGGFGGKGRGKGKGSLLR